MCGEGRHVHHRLASHRLPHVLAVADLDVLGQVLQQNPVHDAAAELVPGIELELLSDGDEVFGVGVGAGLVPSHWGARTGDGATAAGISDEAGSRLTLNVKVGVGLVPGTGV